MLKYIQSAKGSHPKDIPRYGLQLKSKGDLSMYHLRLKGDYYQMGVKEETYFKKLIFPFHSSWMIFNWNTENEAKKF